MLRSSTALKDRSWRTCGIRLSVLLTAFATLCCAPTLPAKDHSAEQPPTLMMRMDVPAADLVKAVQQVTQDQIIHGTYSYDKERILYGAHSATSAKPFGTWHGDGQVFYKVAEKVLAPRFFKGSGDIGTIFVRYIVQDAGSAAATLQIDAIYVDARNSRHPSEGTVESREFAAIQQRLKAIQTEQQGQPSSGTVFTAAQSPLPDSKPEQKPSDVASQPSLHEMSLDQLQQQVNALRHEVELRVRDSGAPLKSAPFHSATTLQTLPPQTELLIVVLTPYWYGVETEDGHHGWVHRSELEPLP